MQPLHATDLHRQRHHINIAEHQIHRHACTSALQSVLYGKIFRRNFSPRPNRFINDGKERKQSDKVSPNCFTSSLLLPGCCCCWAAAPSIPATRSCCSCCYPWCWQFQRSWLAHLAATISSVYTSTGLIRRMRLINSLAEHNWSSVSDYTTEAVSQTKAGAMSQTTTGAAVYTSNTFSAPGTLLYSRK